MSEIQLRDYQEEMIEGARAAIKQGIKRILLQAPCGAGKTVIGSFMIKGIAGRRKRVTFMTHRGELAKQASKTFVRVGIEHAYIMAAFTPNPMKLVQVAMVDTLRNRYLKIDIPDVLVIDECHHAVSASWRAIIEYYVSKGTLIIGLSATPQRLDGRPLNDLFDHMVLGPSPKDLIARGSLSQFDYYAPPQIINLTGVTSKFGDYDQTKLAEASNLPKVFGDAIEHYQTILHGKRAIAFCVNIAGSKRLVEQFVAAGIPALHVDGEMPQAERAAAIKSFEAGDTWILSNVSLFGEGFDVAACDGVIMLRATQSLSLHIQMCGRALRPHESKERAVILDHVGNLSRHGLPDEDHEWSLEGRKKKKGKKKDADEPMEALAQCPHCYSVFRPEPTCPTCGHVMEKKKAQDAVAEGTLEKITPEQAALISKGRKTEVAMADSLDALKRIAAERGYKASWAKHIWDSRARKAAARVPPLPPPGHPALFND